MDVILGSVLRTRHSLHGVGGQFDHHLSMPDEKQGVLSGVISAAQIGHSRIFVPARWGAAVAKRRPWTLSGSPTGLG